jgi:hypothetical protein
VRNILTTSLRNGLQLLLALPKSDPVNERRQPGSFILAAFVVAPEKFGQLLVEVENKVGIAIFSRHRVGPQLFHEENLIRELRNATFDKINFSFGFRNFLKTYLTKYLL